MSDQNTIKLRPFITPADLLTCDPGLHEPDRETGEGARFIIYALLERRTGRRYVGLTSRTLAQRITAHLSQARRDKPVRTGGLMEALRQAEASGMEFAYSFDARVVARAADVETARVLERRWIVMLSAQKPEGFNEMPGGSSVGGQDNARPLEVTTAPGKRQIYRSINDAIANRNHTLRARGLPILQPSTVYARLAEGWPPEEALGYTRRDDGRSQRALFRLDGVPYTTLGAAADVSGVPIATLRSRLHRAARDNRAARGIAEIGTDRRSCRSVSSSLAIPWPGTKERLTAEAFAARSGIAKSTVMHRWHRVRRQLAQGCEQLSPTALHQWLTTGTDRRKVLRLVMPDGRVWVGGERELARRVLGDRRLEAVRPYRLSESGIRRRLRMLSLQDREDAALVARAFGFAPAHAARGEG